MKYAKRLHPSFKVINSLSRKMYLESCRGDKIKSINWKMRIMI